MVISLIKICRLRDKKNLLSQVSSITRELGYNMLINVDQVVIYVPDVKYHVRINSPGGPLDLSCQVEFNKHTLSTSVWSVLCSE